MSIRVMKFQGRRRTYVFPTKVSSDFPNAYNGIITPFEVVADYTSRSLEIIATSSPVFLVAHVVLEDAVFPHD